MTTVILLAVAVWLGGVVVAAALCRSAAMGDRWLDGPLGRESAFARTPPPTRRR